MSSNPETAPNFEISQVVDYVFSRPPGAPRSYWMDVSTDSLDDDSTLEQREEMLLSMYVDIAALGCKKLWGEDFQWQTMTREQYSILQRYMKSFGVLLNIRCNDDSLDPWDVAENDGIEAVKYLRFSIDFVNNDGSVVSNNNTITGSPINA